MVSLLIVTATCFYGARPAMGQQIAEHVVAGEQSHASTLFRHTKVYQRNEAALNRVVAAEFQETSRKKILERVAEAGGFRIGFDPDLGALEEPISLKLENATVFEALQEATRGSDLLLSLTYQGLIIVRKSVNQAPRPLPSPPAKRAAPGQIVGTIRDANSGEPLPGATVRVEGTTLGSATDIEGEYRIAGVPAGEQVLHVSYVGYEHEEIAINVPDGGSITQDVGLSYGVIEGEEVVITAQLEGQARAINQQLASETIVNVVSSDRIQELPDANAAESVGRLPGVAVQRNAGEGQKVVIRGLSPKYSSVTINGARVPPTRQSRNVIVQELPGTGQLNPSVDDRSVDLSMMSPDILAGIEVFKSLTPDQDADAIGGTVNAITRSPYAYGEDDHWAGRAYYRVAKDREGIR